MTDLTQPHDRFFKALISHPETAGALLREYLPPAIVALLAPEPPELVEGSFVSEELRPYFSDRLFRARTLGNKTAFFYTLIEHKSYSDRKVALQLARGIMGIMEQEDRADPDWKLLPAVVPMVLHHGAQAWKIPCEFLALVDADDALRSWLLNFPFTVVDLGPIPNRQLAHYARLRAGLMVLKYGTRDPTQQQEAMEEIVEALREAPELLIPVVVYMMTTFAELNQATVRGIVVRVCPKEENEMMSIFAREIIDQGRQEGILIGEQKGIQIGEKKGRQEEASSILLRQMRRRFDQLPDWVVGKINTADTELLEIWSERILDARSIADVFSD